MTTPHDRALEARNELRDKIAENLADSLDDGLNWMKYREQADTCLEAITAFGGIVCAREPAAWQYAVDDVAFDVTTDKTNAAHLATMVPVIPLHLPIEAGNGGDEHDIAAMQAEIETLRHALNACQQQAIQDGNTIAGLRAWQQGALSCREAEQARIDEYRFLAEAGSSQDGWLDILSAPKDGTHILLYAPPREFRGEPVAERLTYGYWDAPEHGAYLGDCGGECRCSEYDDAPEPYWFSDDGGFTEEHPPTHWRPLPPPPSPSNEGEKQS